MSSQFNVEQLKSLPTASNEQLKQMETQIQQEFKSIVKQYLEGRLSRINTMMGDLDTQIKQFQDNDKTWNKIYSFESDTVNNIKMNQENIINNSRNGIRHYSEFEKEVIEVINHIQSPLQVDSYLTQDEKLVFENFFKSSVVVCKTDLDTIANESKYQLELINNDTERQKTHIWLSHRAKLLDQRDKLIDKHLKELQELNKQYYNEVPTKMYHQEWINYHNLVKTPKDLDENNRIEITNIKNNILRHLPGTLGPCSGLTNDEITQDLNILLGNNSQLVGDEQLEPDDGLASDIQEAYDRLLANRLTHDLSGGDNKLPDLPPLEFFN